MTGISVLRPALQGLHGHPGRTTLRRHRRQQIHGRIGYSGRPAGRRAGKLSFADAADAVGTAAMIRAGLLSRRLCIAASIVNPDARPSSTRITVFPAGSGANRVPVKRATRSLTFFLVSAIASSTSGARRPSAERRSSLISTCPSQVTAPNPDSVVPGIRIFRDDRKRQRSTKNPGNFPANRHATGRDGKDQRVLYGRESFQKRSQSSSRIMAGRKDETLFPQVGVVDYVTHMRLLCIPWHIMVTEHGRK